MAKNNASVDGSKIDRQIYNPFPRAVGHAAKSGMSRGAAHVLSRLAVYTNFTGETWVGFDTLLDETQGGNDYVSAAIKELYAIRRVTRVKRYNKRTGERLSDLKQLWCTREELLLSGVKESDLGNYPFKPKQYFDDANSAFRSKAHNKSSALNKTSADTNSVFRSKATKDVTSDENEVTNSDSPIQHGCPSSDTLSQKSPHDAENTIDVPFLENRGLTPVSGEEHIENLKTKPEHTITTKKQVFPGE